MNEIIIFYKSISRAGSCPCEVEEEMFGVCDADVISGNVLLQEVTNSGIEYVNYFPAFAIVLYKLTRSWRFM